MNKRISVCGKGGSGKSTVVALLAQELSVRDWRVIVVDSDESNACIHWMLGFEHPPRPLLELVGGKKSVQKQMRKTYSDGDNSDMAVLSRPAVAVDDLPADYLVENDGRVLITVGKIHQALEGCACPMGVLSREFLKKLQLAEDEMLLVDMEAGIEHFGRGVETSIDAVIAVVEPSLESLVLAEKVQELASQAGANFAGVITNKVRSADVASALNAELRSRDLLTIGSINYDEKLLAASLTGHPTHLAGDEVPNIVDTLLLPHDRAR
jgi:CO dehydrogenase maturation factor